MTSVVKHDAKALTESTKGGASSSFRWNTEFGILPFHGNKDKTCKSCARSIPVSTEEMKRLCVPMTLPDSTPASQPEQGDTTVKGSRNAIRLSSSKPVSGDVVAETGG